MDTLYSARSQYLQNLIDEIGVRLVEARDEYREAYHNYMYADDQGGVDTETLDALEREMLSVLAESSAAVAALRGEWDRPRLAGA